MLFFIKYIIFIFFNDFKIHKSRNKFKRKFSNYRKFSIIATKNFGEEIEKFKSVIRFNLAPIENFEKNVGSKTTAWFCAQNGAQIKAFREWLIFNNIKDQKLFDRNFMNLHNQKIIYCDVSGKNPLQLNIDYHESNRVYNFDYTSNLYLRYNMVCCLMF